MKKQNRFKSSIKWRFTGIFMGTGVQTVVKMLIPAIIPFNAVKAGINVLVAGVLYKKLGKTMDKD